MTNGWELLHADMLADLDRTLQLEHPEKENVESCFWIARNYWTQLQERIRGDGFRDKETEIDFFRNVKPGFAKYIEYFSLLS